MSVFEPEFIIAILKLSLLPGDNPKVFEENWKDSVGRRIEAWKNSHPPEQMASDAQLTWEANVVQYVDHLYQRTKRQKDSKTHCYGLPNALLPTILLFGPRFLPPSYLHIQCRHPAPSYNPTQAYLKPINIVHPFYYPQLAQCPVCKSKDILWEGWTSTGSRRIHGITCEETALGFQRSTGKYLSFAHR
ncbi:hypothetical protein BC826DRAFT_1090503 [Russula brevipes]|nr:hypothetical protein BC826DRAFT_1090503 [Russula brevipes]